MSLDGANGIEQAEAADFGDLGERGGDLFVAGVGHALGEAGEDAFLLVLARADDEGEAEALVVLSVETREGGDLVRGEAIESGGGLLTGGGRSKGSGEGGASDQVGVRLNQRDLPFDWRGVTGGAEFGVEVSEGGRQTR